MSSTRNAQVFALTRGVSGRGAIGCFSHSTKPLKRNAAAVLGFIVASPGTILLKTAISRHQPKSTSAPTTVAMILATSVYAFIEMVLCGLFEGFMIAPAARRRPHA